MGSKTAANPTRQAVKQLLRRRWTVLEISRELRISPQAVYKHKNRLRRDGELEEASA